MTRESTLTPFDVEGAREAIKVAGRVQAQVEDDLRAASRKLAECERSYREALASETLRLRTLDDKPSWSACENVARGAKTVARLRFERDLADGMLEATKQNAFRRGADRRDLSNIIVWSMKRDLRDDFEGQQEPATPMRAIGGRA